MEKGYTNLSRSSLKRAVNIASSKADYKSGHWVVRLSDGTKRLYDLDMVNIGGYGRNWYTHTQHALTQEITPNGNRLLFTYALHDKRLCPQTIVLLNRSKQIVSQLFFGYYDDHVIIRSSRGDEVVYHQNRETHTYKASKGNSDRVNAKFLKAVSSSQKTLTHYHLIDRPSAKSGGKIMRVEKPDGRILDIEYNADNQVSKLRAPVGPLGKMTTAYRFVYKKHVTEVSDALNQVTTYAFSDSKRLETIAYFDQDKPIKKEHFAWHASENLQGFLRGKWITAGDSLKALYAIGYKYDERGNCVADTLYGNLSGQGSKAFNPLTLDLGDRHARFIPIDEPIEQRSKKFAYSDDGFNLLIKEETPEGLTTCYSYVKGTNLLSSQFVCYHDKIQERIFNFYDKNGLLHLTVQDDGSKDDWTDLTDVAKRLMTRIAFDPVPHSVTYGKPLTISQEYEEPSTGQIRLLKKTEFSYNARGLETEKRVYGADQLFYYKCQTVYDEKDRVVATSDALGHVTHYEYDANDNKTKEFVDESNAVTMYAYDASDRLVSRQDWHGEEVFVTTYAYDALGRLQAETDAFGQTTVYARDRLGRQIKETKPSQLDRNGQLLTPTIEKQYNLLNQVVAETDENGFTTYTDYNVYGQPALKTYPDQTQETFVYFLNGALKKKTNAEGVSTVYAYDPKNRVIQEETFDSQGTFIQAISYRYKGDSLMSETDAMGVVSSYAYDGAGRLIEENKGGAIKRYQYDALGRLHQLIEPLENGKVRLTIRAYDTLDRLTSQDMCDESQTLYAKDAYQYDLYGHCTHRARFHSADQASIEETLYRSNGDPLYQIDALGRKTSFSYDYAFVNSLGQKVLRKTTLDPLGRQLIETHDAFGRLTDQEIHETQPSPRLAARSSFAYDAAGNRTLQKEHVVEDGQIKRESDIEWTYDCRNRPITVTQNAKTESYAYDALGRLRTKQKPNGALILYSYDPLGRLIAKSSDNGIAYRYSYDLHGNLIETHDFVLNRTQKRRYDLLNRLLEEEFVGSHAVNYAYDALDRLTQLALPDGSSASYFYDACHLRAMIKSRPDQREAYRCAYLDYDLAGNLVLESLPGQAGQVRRRFDLLSRPVSIQASQWSQELDYDAASNLTAFTVQDPSGRLDGRFAYNGLNQLVSEQTDNTHAYAYAYDSLHNRLKQNGQPLLVNALNQIVHDGSTYYIYDANGNLISQRVPLKLYFYDSLDRLLGYSQNGHATHYFYDGLDRCVEIIEDGASKQLLYYQDQEIGCLQNGVVQELRLPHPDPESLKTLAIELQGVPYAVLQNQRGDLCALFELSGAPLEWHRHSAFGLTSIYNERGEQPSSLNPWRFAAKRASHDLVLFGKRWYVPHLGRWLTCDPQGFLDGPNLYAYVHNNPLTHMDIWGLEDLDIRGMGFWQGMQALESYRSYQGSFAPVEISGRFWNGFGAQLLDSTLDPLSNLGRQGSCCAEIANGRFNERFSDLDTFQTADHIGRLAGDAVGTIATLLTFHKSATQGMASQGLKTGVGTNIKLDYKTIARPAKVAKEGVALSRGAESVNAGVNLNRKLSRLENFQQSATGARTMPDGRIRYYDAENISRTAGPTRGACNVLEWNPRTGNVRGWYECHDHLGNINRVHPKNINGQVISSPHYPPTGAELMR